MSKKSKLSKSFKGLSLKKLQTWLVIAVVALSGFFIYDSFAAKNCTGRRMTRAQKTRCNKQKQAKQQAAKKKPTPRKKASAQTTKPRAVTTSYAYTDFLNTNEVYIGACEEGDNYRIKAASKKYSGRVTVYSVISGTANYNYGNSFSLKKNVWVYKTFSKPEAEGLTIFFTASNGNRDSTSDVPDSRISACS